jgi:YidC/Oxa1 family membrane protein insertase
VSALKSRGRPQVAPVARCRVRFLAALVAVMLAVTIGPTVGQAQAVKLPGENQLILINLQGGLPARWESCAGPCARPGTTRAFLLRAGEGGNRIDWEIPGDAAATQRLGALAYRPELFEVGDDAAVVLESVEPWQGLRLVHRYRIGPAGHVLEASIQLPPGARLRVTAGDDLRPPALPGLGAMYSQTRAVRVDADGQASLRGAEPPTPLPAGGFAGIRGRFWSLLATVPDGFVVQGAAADLPTVVMSRPDGDGGIAELRWYGGPVQREALTAADPVLANQLYAALWTPLRWLSRGLQWILEWWQSVVGSWGLAIILLSATVKLLMAPLTAIAERLQAQVNRTRSQLEPELAAIRRELRGEEGHRATLAVYARHGVSPWYTLKSLAGVLLQIPIFIAAFDMLGEQFGLAGAAFLWIRDLALPDQALRFAAPAPFFGGWFNLLPVIMTGLTLLASRLQEEPGLAPELRRGQRRRLYAMAAVFFVLLYTFPAGMVLYWTTNNALHLGVVLVRRWRDRAPKG